MSMSITLAFALGLPSQAPDPQQDLKRIEAMRASVKQLSERPVMLADVARLPANDVIASWQNWCDQAFGNCDLFSRDEQLPSLFRWALDCYRTELKRSLTMLRRMQGARDERLDKEGRLGDLRWLRDNYPFYWRTELWPVPKPDPTLADADRLPTLKVIVAWQNHCSAAFSFCHEWSKDRKVPSDKPLPSVFRWAVSSYQDELLGLLPMIGNMQDPRHERMDKDKRIRNLRWLRDHYPDHWYTGVWPVPQVLGRFTDNRPKEPRAVPRAGPNGETLPPEQAKPTKDS
jgi:hypothetical protein